MSSHRIVLLVITSLLLATVVSPGPGRGRQHDHRSLTLGLVLRTLGDPLELDTLLGCELADEHLRRSHRILLGRHNPEVRRPPSISGQTFMGDPLASWTAQLEERRSEIRDLAAFYEEAAKPASATSRRPGVLWQDLELAPNPEAGRHLIGAEEKQKAAERRIEQMFALLNIVSLSELDQARTAEANDLRRLRFSIEMLAAVFLFPTFVATVISADIKGLTPSPGLFLVVLAAAAAVPAMSLLYLRKQNELHFRRGLRRASPRRCCPQGSSGEFTTPRLSPQLNTDASSAASPHPLA
jgi:hypothetical protein